MKNGLLVTIAVGVWGLMKIVGKLVKSILWVLTNIVIFFGLYVPLFYLAFGLILLSATDFSFGVMGTNQILFFIGLGLCLVVSVMITLRTFVIRPLSSIFEPLRNSFAEIREEREHRKGQRRRREEDDPYEGIPARRSAYPEDRGYADRDRREVRGFRDRGYEEPPYEQGYRAPQDDNYEDRRRAYASDASAPDRYFSRADSYGEARSARDDGYAYGEATSYDPPEASSSYRYAVTARDMGERPLIYYSRRRPGVLVKEYSDRFELYEETQNGRQYLGTEYKDD